MVLGVIGLFLAAFAALLLWDYLWRKRRNDMLHYMPGPRPLPLLGNVLMYRGLDAERESPDVLLALNI